ncbi:MAG: P-loop NTPase fold protein, partial [Planctomycetaceae bacterium]
FVVAGHTRGPLRIWEHDGMTELPGVPETLGYAFSPDSRLLATMGTVGEVRLHDLTLGGDPVTLENHHVESDVHDCGFSPDGRMLASVGGDGRCYVWDVASRTLTLELRSCSWRCLFSPDGSLLATFAYQGDAILLWHMPNGDRHSELPLQTRAGEAPFAFSPDSRLLVAGEGAFVSSWDIAPMPQTRPPLPPVLERPRVSFFGGNPFLSFSRDGRVIATEDDFGVTRLWDVASGAERARLSSGGERTLAFSPESGVFATVSNAGDVRLCEEIAPPGLLPAVVSDSTEGPDVIGVAADAAALANLIAAGGTRPPLSIGLFGDWGSGKSFLIRQVQAKV